MAEFARKDIALSFGLISTTVRLTGAVEKDTTPRLSTLCVGNESGNAHPPVQAKQTMTCTECGPITDKSTLVKGSKSGGGYVIVDTETVQNVRSETAEQHKKSIKFTAHPAEEVLTRTAPNGTLYYLEPQTPAAVEAYGLLRDLIRDNPDKAFVSLYTVTSRIGMYVARVHNDAIVLEGLHRTSDLKSGPELPDMPENEALAGMAQQFLNSMVTEFDPESYEDTYAARLAEMLDVGTPVAALEGEAPTNTGGTDLMAALQAEMEKLAAS